jgi:uncharacterized protein (DUF427 family)
MQRPQRIPPGPGQESVWDYPRPPRVEPVAKRIRVVFNGETIADTTRAYRVLETSHPPTYYLPLDDIRADALVPVQRQTFCEFKGLASYFDVQVGDRVARAAAWTYRSPSPGYEAIADHVAFYPSRMDACYVDDERVEAQPGDFYGGWVTRDIVGPFKGSPGTAGW